MTSVRFHIKLDVQRIILLSKDLLKEGTNQLISNASNLEKQLSSTSKIKPQNNIVLLKYDLQIILNRLP